MSSTDPAANPSVAGAALPATGASAPRRADASRNRAAVVAAGFEVLSRHPEASMQDVAAASGLGRTTVYRHFPSREALITALFEEVFGDATRAVEAILEAADAPAEVFPRLAAELLDLGDRYGFLEAHRDLGEAVRRQHRDEPLLAWIARQIDAGTLQPLGAAWIQAVASMIIAAAFDEIHAGRETRESAAEKLSVTLLAAFAT